MRLWLIACLLAPFYSAFAAGSRSNASRDSKVLEIEYPSDGFSTVEPYRSPLISGPMPRSPALSLSAGAIDQLGSARVKKATGWARNCKSLASVLRQGKGLYGTGFFARVNCLARGESAKAPWRLRVAILPDTIEFQLGKRVSVQNTYKDFGSVRIPNTKRSLDYLRVNDFALLLSLAINDQLPSAFAFSRPKSLPGKIEWHRNSQLKSDRPAKAPGPYERLTVEASAAGRTQKFLATINGETYQTSKAILDQKAESYHAHNFWGQGSRSIEIEASIVALMQDLSGLSLSSLVSGATNDLLGFFELSLVNGYFGFRLGVPFGPSVGALKQSKAFGFLVVVRGGPLDGFRYSADFIPESTHKNEVGEEKIDWSRHLVGYSFDYSLKYFTVDLTPKIGAWNFVYALPQVLPISQRVVTPEIEIKRRFSLGIELGAEYRRDVITLRAYTALDRAMPQISRKGDSLYSNRLGLDVYWSGASNFEVFTVDFHPTFLGFVMRDSFTMNQALVEGAEAVIQDTSVQSSYIGLGIALKW